MLWLYNFSIFFYSLVIRILTLVNPKARLFNQGRKNIFPIIQKKISSGDKNIWFHFASLGEFEQGRPVLENIKANYPSRKIVITFFSPSGYEIRKNYEIADAVFYLPMDTEKNAKKFLTLVNPEIAVFTKYEFWHHYFKELHARNTPLFLISGIFRPGQIFFKWYGGFNRNTLKYITHFFVQNEESVQLLNRIHLKNISLSGDTRFDRVAENAQAAKNLESIENFIENTPVIIAGSTWPQDEVLIAGLINKHPDWKLIIAPHEIDEEHLVQMETLFPKAVKYSERLKRPDDQSKILIIDNIGLLSSLYRYGNICYIGGGFGAGIHNTLEAAAFGLPVIFGPKYQKFQEAKDLITLGGAISIKNIEDLEYAFQSFVQHPENGIKAKAYVEQKKGAATRILKEIKKYLN